jgi:hypothetical protein
VYQARWQATKRASTVLAVQRSWCLLARSHEFSESLTQFTSSYRQAKTSDPAEGRLAGHESMGCAKLPAGDGLMPESRCAKVTRLSKTAALTIKVPGDPQARRIPNQHRNNPRREPCPKKIVVRLSAFDCCVRLTVSLAVAANHASLISLASRGDRKPVRVRHLSLSKGTAFRIVEKFPGTGMAVGIAPAAVELGKEALPTFEPLGSGCRIRKGEQRHDDCYHAFIARARAQP